MTRQEQCEGRGAFAWLLFGAWLTLMAAGGCVAGIVAGWLV
jgi:hypothetical protein